jgi:HAD superfamily hydrolase (TIGR01493 family)
MVDFSGTLFQIADHRRWRNHAGESLRSSTEQAEALSRLTAPTGSSTQSAQWREVSPWRELWAQRDLDPTAHRQVFTEVLRRNGLSDDLAEQVYAGLASPRFWEPYPDTTAALRVLRSAGLPVAVVSNIAWDITAVFDEHGVSDLIDEFVLSYLEGTVKPEERIFRIACERLGVAPEDTLMIGDNAADQGAAAVGARTALVEPLPTNERPRALLDVLATHRINC